MMRRFVKANFLLPACAHLISCPVGFTPEVLAPEVIWLQRFERGLASTGISSSKNNRHAKAQKR